MEQNRVLLSQAEIDTLLSFLLDNKSNVYSDVMDQSSIDKLISILQSRESFRFRFDSMLPAGARKGNYTSLVLDDNENIGDRAKECRLDFEIKDNNFISVFCINQTSGHRFVISPSCIEQLRYFSDKSSQWGFCIPPIIFDTIASMLGVTYTRVTYEAICERFSTICFGSSSAAISPIYLPSDASLIENLVIV